MNKEMKYVLSIEASSAIASVEELRKATEDFNQTNKVDNSKVFEKYNAKVGETIAKINSLKEALQESDTAWKNADKSSSDAKKSRNKLDKETEEYKRLTKVIEENGLVKSKHRSASTSLTNAIAKEQKSLSVVTEEIKKYTAEASRTITVQEKLRNSTANVGEKLKSVGGSASSFGSSIKGAGLAVAGFIAAGSLKQFASESLEAFKTAESAFNNFQMTVKSTGNSVSEGMKVINEITASGLVTTAEAMETMNNYLKMGFSMDQVKGQMKRDLDLGSARKQSHYGTVGEAMKVASQGLLQGNSTLSDALGNDKNISVIFEEYAKGIGKTVDLLTKEDKVLAVIKASRTMDLETRGAAAKATQTLAGKEAQLSANYTKTKEIVGQSLVPAYKMLMEAGDSLMTGVKGLINGLKALGLTAANFFAQVGALWDYAFDWDTDKYDKKMKELKEIYNQGIEDIVKESKGAFFDGQDDDVKGKKKSEVAKTEAEIANEKRKAEDIDLKKEKLAQEKSLIQLKMALDDKKIAIKDFLKAEAVLTNSIANIDIKLKDNEKSSVQYNLDNGVGLTSENKAEMQLRLAEIDKEQAELEASKRKKSYAGTSRSTGEDVAKASSSRARARLENEMRLMDRYARSEEQLVQEQFDSFTISAEEYYKKKEQLAVADFKRQVDLKNDELSRVKAITTTNEVERIDKLKEIEKLESDLKIIELDRAEALKKLTTEQIKYNEAQAKKVKERSINNKYDLDNTEADLELIGQQSRLNTQSISNTEYLQAEINHNQKLLENYKSYMAERVKLAGGNQEEIDNLRDEEEKQTRQFYMTQVQLEQELMAEKKATYIETKTLILETFKELGKSIFEGAESMKDVLKNAADKMKDIALNAAMNNIINISGMNKEGGVVDKMASFLSGDFLSGDSEKSTKQMQVTAGVVNVNGGSGGGGAMAGAMGAMPGAGAGGQAQAQDSLLSMFDGLGDKISGVFDSLGNSLSSMFSSVLSSLGGSGGSGGLGGILGSLFGGMGSFDTGADKLSRDMIAKVHKGERILTAKENKSFSPFLNNPAQYIKNMGGVGGGSSVVNNFTVNGNIDKRTQSQLANMTTDSLSSASRNR